MTGRSSCRRVSTAWRDAPARLRIHVRGRGPPPQPWSRATDERAHPCWNVLLGSAGWLVRAWAGHHTRDVRIELHDLRSLSPSERFSSATMT
jgi:hypothetical protein